MFVFFLSTSITLSCTKHSMTEVSIPKHIVEPVAASPRSELYRCDHSEQYYVRSPLNLHYIVRYISQK